jgi:hypothetical protein
MPSPAPLPLISGGSSINPACQRSSPLAAAPAKLPHSADWLRRKPTRISATLPWGLAQRLQERADAEGRSLSNLIAHQLEGAPADPCAQGPTTAIKGSGKDTNPQVLLLGFFCHHCGGTCTQPIR